MDPLQKSIPNWERKLKQSQHIEDDYHSVDKNLIINSVYSQNYEQIGYLKEWRFATGYGFMALATKLLFTYFGGMVQARRQFIPGYFYFTNRFYNWVGGAKYIVGGYLLGSIVSSFTFGQPFILEDLLRRQFRKHLNIGVFEGPFPHINHISNLSPVPPRDPFIRHE